MSNRWFFSYLRRGVAAGAPATGELRPGVEFLRMIDGGAQRIPASGPRLRMACAQDVTAIDRSLVIREEPPPGTAAADESIMATVEFAFADLPWLLSTRSVVPPGSNVPQPLPWIVLVVLREDEATAPREASPTPILTAPLSALPELDESWAWAHVEARLDDSVSDAATAAGQVLEQARRRSADVVARLMCPRKLSAASGWIAAVVPAPASGRWPDPGAGNTVELPVFHWWRFRTGDAGTFEDLARRLRHVDAADLAIGARTVDVSAPWPGQADPVAAGSITVALDGALRAPGADGDETWSDADAQGGFRDRLVVELNAPARRHDGAGRDGEADRDVLAVGPPLYGSHHTGEQTVSGTGSGWMTTLNTEVRRRVAAALGARYVQVEQEFLMARAWEQAGAIKEANRLLAVAELAALAAEASRMKNIVPLPAARLVTTMAPLANRMSLRGFAVDADAAPSLAEVLQQSRIPDGLATTAYARLTRTGGALSRRIGRLAGDRAHRSLIEEQMPVASTAVPGFPAAPGFAEAGAESLPDVLRLKTAPTPLQLRRMAEVVEGPDLLARALDEPRPLRPIMAHPHFGVPIGEELLARWPEWALPGVSDLPDESVIVLETNPAFVAALLTGLNQEFNRELLWREFPTDQRGTPFARFWPTPGADVDEIARWPLDGTLADQVRGGAEGNLVLAIRGEVLRRFPATPVVAVKGENGKLPRTFAGTPGNPVPLDDSTVLYLFPNLSEERAKAEDWFFVLREPMRSTQFGFDLGSKPLRTWSDLTWAAVTDDAGFVRLTRPFPEPAAPGADAAKWGSESGDMARIAFQQPFQLAFRARFWLA